MEKKIVLAGGTGFIGQYLQRRYEAMGYTVVIISRKKGHVQWGDTKAIAQALENASLVVGLAGKSVDCRYTKKNKALIFSSRLSTTHQLGEAILQCKQPPALWINSSTATIYRHAEDRPMTEQGGDIGQGFSVEVGKAWEKEFFCFSLPATRQAVLRIAIVLGKEGGALVPYARMTKLGFGGVQGNGRQMFSWIHIADVFNIISFLETQKLAGVFNVSAPNPVRNQDFMKTMRKELKIPFGLPLPKILLEAGALVIGTSPELLLKSRWVLPEKLLTNGFEFEFPDLRAALVDLLGK